MKLDMSTTTLCLSTIGCHVTADSLLLLQYLVE
jgi:hypothetical protein